MRHWVYTMGGWRASVETSVLWFSCLSHASHHTYCCVSSIDWYTAALVHSRVSGVALAITTCCCLIMYILWRLPVSSTLRVYTFLCDAFSNVCLSVLFAVCRPESIGHSSTLCAWSVNTVVTHCNLVHVCCNGCTMVSIQCDSTVLLAVHNHPIKSVLSV